MNREEVKNTKLFKAIAPKIKSISNKQLARELSKALNASHRDGTTEELICAFGWKGTPQGYDFWAALDTEALKCA